MLYPTKFMKATTVSVVASVFIAGCASTGSGPGGRPTAEEVRGERVAQGAGMGCAGGAVAGALIGLALGGNNGARNALIGAAAGCATGAVAGAMYGDYVDARARQYANAQDRYIALSAAAEKDLKNFQAYNAKTQVEVTQLRTNVAAMQAGVRSGQITADAYRQEVSQLNAKIAEMKQRAQQLTVAINDVGQDASAMQSAVGSTAELTLKRKALMQERQKLLAMIDTLSSVSAKANA